jgi:hypothetical protein
LNAPLDEPRFVIEPEQERVQLAIVELSSGNKAKLLELVRVAKIDYRDILARQSLRPMSEDEGAALQQEARAVIERWGKQ